ncbi:MAG: response regulator transcription factor [Chloroflexi bacterium]|nr:MAG: response regulator transcription factor [Chloroflexota bacterium]
MEPTGHGSVSFLSGDRQPAPRALVGGAGRHVRSCLSLSSPGIGSPGARDRSYPARIRAGTAQHATAPDSLCLLWTAGAVAGRGGGGLAVLQGRLSEALAVLERALVLARPSGFIRTFADLPPLATLLQELRKRRKASHAADSKLDTYLQRILVAMNPQAAQAASLDGLLRQEGLEPLTDRELQILRLLDKNLTNKEIARELVVTSGTVKVHTTNVYRKLSVNNRHAAVTLSKALGLVAAS